MCPRSFQREDEGPETPLGLNVCIPSYTQKDKLQGCDKTEEFELRAVKCGTVTGI